MRKLPTKTPLVFIISFLLLVALFATMACAKKGKSKVRTNISAIPTSLSAFLDTIWKAEQEPIAMRDSLMDIYGAESKEAAVYQEIFRKNHSSNIRKIRAILDDHGWPDTHVIGDHGNRSICNVLQHADQKTRELYLPMMRQAVLDKKLEPRYLVRAEDRLATDRGELQIYGGQMKYYPETKSFNIWPVFDPINIDKRRAEIGLGPIAENLMNRFDFEWNLEEQIKRTKEFTKQKNIPKE